MPFAFPGQSIVTRGGQRVVVPGDLFSPFSLGTLLLGWWDAEDASTLTLASGAVASWRDKVAGYDLAQASAGLRPAYSAASFNNRPGVTFDGTDDYLEMASVPFPTGATPSEMWALVSQDSLPADATARDIFSYGGGVNGRRTLRRTVNAGANSFTALGGTGAAAPAAEVLTPAFSGIHVVRLIQSATDIMGSVDGGAPVTTAGVPNTATTRTRMGARVDTLSNYFNGKVNAAIVTGLLTDDQAAQLTAYLKQRGGIS